MNHSDDSHIGHVTSWATCRTIFVLLLTGRDPGDVADSSRAQEEGVRAMWKDGGQET